MSTATITSKGQVTVPKDVRDALHLAAGDRLRFRLRDDGVVEVVPETVDLMTLCGMIQPTVRGITLEAMAEAIAAGATGE